MSFFTLNLFCDNQEAVSPYRISDTCRDIIWHCMCLYTRQDKYNGILITGDGVTEKTKVNYGVIIYKPAVL